MQQLRGSVPDDIATLVTCFNFLSTSKSRTNYELVATKQKQGKVDFTQSKPYFVIILSKNDYFPSNFCSLIKSDHPFSFKRKFLVF